MRLLNPLAEIGAVVVIAGVGGFLLASRGKPQVATNGFVPFTAQLVQKHFQTPAAKAPASIQYITVERRSDGSEATWTTVASPDKQTGLHGEILDATSFKHVIVSPSTKSVMTFYLSENDFNGELDSGHCPVNPNTLSEHSKMLGYDVVRYQTKYGADSGASGSPYVTYEAWVAPELACFALQEKDALSAKRQPWNETTVVSITKGEPASAAFDIPAGYVERSPSEVADAWASKFPGSKWMSENALSHLERNYDAHRENFSRR